MVKDQDSDNDNRPIWILLLFSPRGVGKARSVPLYFLCFFIIFIVLFSISANGLFSGHFLSDFVSFN